MYNINPRLFPKKNYNIRTVGIGNDRMPTFTFQFNLFLKRNVNFPNISYCSKSTSINTQYCGLWDMLWVWMLFTKDHLKENALAEIMSWKVWYWLISKFSTE